MIHIFGRNFTIYDADKYTKDFLVRELGLPEQVPQECPHDRYQDLLDYRYEKTKLYWGRKSTGLLPAMTGKQRG